MTPPKQAVRRKCVECVKSPYECGGDQMIGQGDENNVCYFFPYRNGNGRPSVKVIRKFCLECMGGTKSLVATCTATSCSVHPFRFGTNPNRINATIKKVSNRGAEAGFRAENRAIDSMVRR